MATEEIKVSDMTFLETIPDDAKIYIVKPGATTPYYTTKAALLAGISSGTTPNLQTVTDGAGNNVTTNPLIVGTGVATSKITNEQLEIGVGGLDRALLTKDFLQIKGSTYVTDGEFFINGAGEYCIIRIGEIETQNGVYPLPTGVSSPLTTEAYVNDVVDGIKTKQPVRVATTAPISLISLQTIDGITVEENDRVLVKDHVSPYLNGIYLAKADFWERTSDANTASELVNAVVSVLEGTVNGNSTFRQTATTIILDTTNIVWVTFGTSVPDASPTTKGKAKLYNSFGANTDGGVTQEAVTNALKSNQYATNAITFKNPIGDYFGTITTPRTGALTFDITDAVTGGVSIVYYQDATLQMPSVWLQTGMEFLPNQINKLYFERDSEGYITMNIINVGVDVTAPSTIGTLTITDE